jgi:hypothetical protein
MAVLVVAIALGLAGSAGAGGAQTAKCYNDAEASYITGGAYRLCVENRPIGAYPR